MGGRLGKEPPTSRSGIRRHGDKSMISTERVNAIVKAVLSGCNKVTSAGVAGVTSATVKNWMNRGQRAWEKAKYDATLVKKDDELYVTLFRGVKKAEADAIQRNIMLIQLAGKKTWQAAAWWLERAHPSMYGQNRGEIREVKKQLAEVQEQLIRDQAERAAAAKADKDGKA